MQNGLKFSFKIDIDPKFRGYVNSEPGSMYGIITINDFSEHFYMSSSWWSIDDYKLQWKLAVERLYRRENSCFVVNVQPFTPMFEMWLMYVVDDLIYIQNRIVVSDLYNDLLKGKSITPDNSFEFMPIREISIEDDLISEWSIKYD